MTAEKMYVGECNKTVISTSIVTKVLVLVLAILFAKVLLVILTIVFTRIINMPAEADQLFTIPLIRLKRSFTWLV